MLLLLLLAENRGSDFVRGKVLRVFTYGAPPVTYIDTAGAQPTEEITSKGVYHCPVLSAFDLPASTIYGYAQPWDPIIRLFSRIDALYPLIGKYEEINSRSIICCHKRVLMTFQVHVAYNFLQVIWEKMVSRSTLAVQRELCDQ